MGFAPWCVILGGYKFFSPSNFLLIWRPHPDDGGRTDAGAFHVWLGGPRYQRSPPGSRLIPFPVQPKGRHGVVTTRSDPPPSRILGRALAVCAVILAVALATLLAVAATYQDGAGNGPLGLHSTEPPRLS